MLGQHGQLFEKMGRHGDRTKAAVSAWLSEDFSVGTYTRHQIEEQVQHYAKISSGVDRQSRSEAVAKSKVDAIKTGAAKRSASSRMLSITDGLMWTVRPQQTHLDCPLA